MTPNFHSRPLTETLEKLKTVVAQKVNRLGHSKVSYSVSLLTSSADRAPRSLSEALGK